MDPKKYKDLNVQRGHRYHYFYTPAVAGKPTLLFIHGFPASSFEWSRQVAFFQPKGYGILVPDCLGYGGSAKPIDPQEYRHKLLAQDFIDILDAENVIENVIGVGHDWGSVMLSALIHHHQDRFAGFVFVELAYRPPSTQGFDLQAMFDRMNKLVGSDIAGHWEYFLQPDAYAMCEKNIDSFLQLMYPPTPELWSEVLCPRGKAQEWIEADRKAGRAPWLTEEEYTRLKETFVKHGLRCPMTYYTVQKNDINIADHKAIPQEAYLIKKPTLFVAGSRDVVSRAVSSASDIYKYAPHAQIVEANAGHWVQFEATEEWNDEMEKWLISLN